MREIYKNGDSITAKFSKSSHFNSRAGTLYKIRMQSTYRALEDHAKVARWGKDVSPTNLTEKQLKGFVQARLHAGLAPRTIQNEVSHIRRALAGVGRKEFAEIVCENKKIGVPSASRIGIGKVVKENVLVRAREAAKPDTLALLNLQRSLGLRIREAVCATSSLKVWLKALEAENHVITITLGTKGGRIRDVYVRPDNISSVKEAIRACLVISKGKDRLVDSSTLKNAVEKHTDRLARIGITGENSSHSLRRAFAMDQFRFYQSQGYDDKTALIRVSRDLGHGDGRGRWVYNNYLRATLESE
jgi:site-specific recombinase XerC